MKKYEYATVSTMGNQAEQDRMVDYADNNNYLWGADPSPPSYTGPATIILRVTEKEKKR